MDEDSNDVPRVTRARTRRMSALESDGRPLTPLLDMPADRASPRNLRRTRLNSATMDLRTPTRVTRRSVARGETPEPSTPVSLAAAKRALRTPAKSARKQLMLKEEEEVESSKISNSSEKVKDAAAKPVVAESPNSANTSGRSSVVTPSEERRVTRSMSKTPPVSGQLINSIPQPQFDMNDSLEAAEQQESAQKQTRTKEKAIAKEPEVPESAASKTGKGLSEGSAASAMNDSLEAQKQTRTKEKAIAQETEVPESAASKTAKGLSEGSAARATNTPKLQVKLKNVLEQTAQSKSPQVEQVPVAGNEEAAAAVKAESAKKEPETAVESPKPELDQNASNVHVTEDVKLPSLTPKTIARVINQPQPEAQDASASRKVGFNVDSAAVEDIKPTFPKTPSRIKSPQLATIDLTTSFKNCISAKSETPIKPFLKGRNSSTPLAKAEEPATPPPPQIDVIKPLESKAAEVSISKESADKLVCKSENASSASEQEEEHDEHEEQEVEEEEEEGSRSVCEFVDHEVEVVDNYQSGDSMDSSERREIEENEIPNDGESVGSQDTEEDLTDDSNEEKLSFIVSDDAVDENDSRNNSVCFSSATEDDFVDHNGKGAKKRRRIIVHESSDESCEESHKRFKSCEDVNDSYDRQLTESIKSSPKKETARALDRSAEELYDISSSSETQEQHAKNPNKTVHDENGLEDVEMIPSSPEASCDKKQISKNVSSGNKSIYEVFDSADETDDESIKDKSTKSTQARSGANKSLIDMPPGNSEIEEESTTISMSKSKPTNEKDIEKSSEDSEIDEESNQNKSISKSQDIKRGKERDTEKLSKDAESNEENIKSKSTSLTGGRRLTREKCQPSSEDDTDEETTKNKSISESKLNKRVKKLSETNEENIKDKATPLTGDSRLTREKCQPSSDEDDTDEETTKNNSNKRVKKPSKDAETDEESINDKSTSSTGDRRLATEKDKPSEDETDEVITTNKSISKSLSIQRNTKKDPKKPSKDADTDEESIEDKSTSLTGDGRLASEKEKPSSEEDEIAGESSRNKYVSKTNVIELTNESDIGKPSEDGETDKENTTNTSISKTKAINRANEKETEKPSFKHAETDEESIKDKSTTLCEAIKEGNESETKKPTSKDEETDEESIKNKSTSQTEARRQASESVVEKPSSGDDETDEDTTKDESMTESIKQATEQNTGKLPPEAHENTQDHDESANESEMETGPDPVEQNRKSSAVQNIQKTDSEAALLAELSSCDISHLQKMFNPLQKSRRQTLYVQGSDPIAAEPKTKVKRRSEQLNIDFKPSQSFIETLAEKKRLQSKRKRMSKSFCGAPEDLDDAAVEEEVQCKKSKKSEHDSPAAESDLEEPVQAVEVESPVGAVEETPQKKPKTEEHPKKPAGLPKTTAEYLEYCDSILQAANEAKLEQKKQRIAEGKKTRLLSKAQPAATVFSEKTSLEKKNSDATKLKKNVKRLQATKQAVKHAMQLLVPETSHKEVSCK
ncbi:hypothetical protein KR222_009762 [Zaprionus bogoriensis]|nr:hypothetical protein KR222_009762 [Zaprionus bogoriensis]